MNRSSRRDFLKAGLGVAAAVSPLFAAAKRAATDWVTLGNSGVKVTRLAFGTGTIGGRVQRELGQEPFTRLVRHAYDRGIRFFETADAYTGMPQMLAAALKGIPRDSYKLMTKFRLREAQGDIRGTIDRLRQDLNSEYLDFLLMHCVRSPNWPEELAKLQDEFSEAQQKKILIAKGASVHGLIPLRRFPGNKWLDVASPGDSGHLRAVGQPEVRRHRGGRPMDHRSWPGPENRAEYSGSLPRLKRFGHGAVT